MGWGVARVDFVVVRVGQCSAMLKVLRCFGVEKLEVRLVQSCRHSGE